MRFSQKILYERIFPTYLMRTSSSIFFLAQIYALPRNMILYKVTLTLLLTVSRLNLPNLNLG